MKKKIIDMLKEGMLLEAGNIAVSSLPANDISPHISTGLVNYSKFYPVRGGLLGTGMVIKGAGDVVKSTKKIGKRRLD